MVMLMINICFLWGYGLSVVILIYLYLCQKLCHKSELHNRIPAACGRLAKVGLLILMLKFKQCGLMEWKFANRMLKFIRKISRKKNSAITLEIEVC